MKQTIRTVITTIATLGTLGLMNNANAWSLFDKHGGVYYCAGITKETSYAQSQETGRRSPYPDEKKAESHTVFVNEDRVIVIATGETPRNSKKQTVFAGKSSHAIEKLNHTSETSFLLDLDKKTLTVMRESFRSSRGFEYHTTMEFNGTCQKK